MDYYGLGLSHWLSSSCGKDIVISTSCSSYKVSIIGIARIGVPHSYSVAEALLND